MEDFRPKLIRFSWESFHLYISCNSYNRWRLKYDQNFTHPDITINWMKERRCKGWTTITMSKIKKKEIFRMEEGNKSGEAFRCHEIFILRLWLLEAPEKTFKGFDGENVHLSWWVIHSFLEIRDGEQLTGVCQRSMLWVDEPDEIEFLEHLSVSWVPSVEEIFVGSRKQHIWEIWSSWLLLVFQLEKWLFFRKMCPFRKCKIQHRKHGLPFWRDTYQK